MNTNEASWSNEHVQINNSTQQIHQQQYNPYVIQQPQKLNDQQKYYQQQQNNYSPPNINQNQNQKQLKHKKRRKIRRKNRNKNKNINKNTEVTEVKQSEQVAMNYQHQTRSQIQNLQIQLASIRQYVTSLTVSVQTMENEITNMKQKQQNDINALLFIIQKKDKNNDDIKEEEEDPKELIKQWLLSFGLSQYYSCFISNGYDSLEFIKAIQNKQELLDIGVMLKGHQVNIMIQIGRLKQNSNVENSSNQIEGGYVNHTLE